MLAWHWFCCYNDTWAWYWSNYVQHVHRCILFPERLNETVQVSVVLQNLTSYIDKLAVLGLQLEGDNPLLLHIIVSYIDFVSWQFDWSVCWHLIHHSIVGFSWSDMGLLWWFFCFYSEAALSWWVGGGGCVFMRVRGLVMHAVGFKRRSSWCKTGQYLWSWALVAHGHKNMYTQTCVWAWTCRHMNTVCTYIHTHTCMHTHTHTHSTIKWVVILRLNCLLCCQLSSLTDHPGVDHIVLPSSHLIRFILFSSSAAAISRLAAAFCRYVLCLPSIRTVIMAQA